MRETNIFHNFVQKDGTKTFLFYKENCVNHTMTSEGTDMPLDS